MGNMIMDFFTQMLPSDVLLYVGSFLDIDTRLAVKWLPGRVSVDENKIKLAVLKRQFHPFSGDHYSATVQNYKFEYNPRLVFGAFIIVNQIHENWWFLCPEKNIWR